MDEPTGKLRDLRIEIIKLATDLEQAPAVLKNTETLIQAALEETVTYSQNCDLLKTLNSLEFAHDLIEHFGHKAYMADMDNIAKRADRLGELINELVVEHLVNNCGCQFKEVR